MNSYSSNGAQGSNAWGDRRGAYAHACGRGFAWRPLELLAMILGFIVFWPVGLAVIGFKIWQRRTGYPGDLFGFVQERAETARSYCRGWQQSWQGSSTERRTGGFSPFGGMRPTGNSAFDEWRDAELARLEEERRKLEDAEREFAAHIEELRRARDREEFERFMAARRTRGTGEASPGATQ